MHDHLPPERGHARGDLQARHLAHSCPGKAVHGVGAHFECKLATIEDAFQEFILRFLQLSFCSLPGAEKLLEDLWQNSFGEGRLDEVLATRSLRVVLRIQGADHALRQKRAVAKVVGHHNRWVQGREIQGRDWFRVVPRICFQDSRSLEGHPVLLASPLERGDEEASLLRLPQNLGENFDALAPGQQKVQRYARDPGHFNVVVHVHQLVQESLGQISILQTIHREPPPGFLVAILQVSNAGVVDILLLLSQKGRRDVVQGVRAELVIALDDGEQVELNPSLDRDLLALPRTVSL
mmetsp:Transcript_1105/g.3244  ORF Transcript_1105/g.3244 Transcript_1105/m.3244 type:complete len:294 (+) Transcript_1105:2233-3114(+)